MRKKENESPVLLPVGSLTDQPIAKAEPEDEGKNTRADKAVTVSGQAHFMGDSSTKPNLSLTPTPLQRTRQRKRQAASGT